MHIPDGFLSAPVWATLDLATAPAVVYVARRAQQDLEESKVPLLGDIPVLGWLFKNNLKSESKKELLIFITPKILKDSLNLH